MHHTRRGVLRGLAAGGAAAVGGCLGGDTASGDPNAVEPSQRSSSTTAGETAAPPTADEPRHVAYDHASLRSNVVSGGVPKDGIPSIDDPQFASADDVDIPGGDPVFGVERGDDVRAYPQYILVHHEIVNDRIAGDPVAVTYCPLTGTAQGFERGETTFGVSGDLLNANLVMYDRGTDSRWPQMLATAIDGPLAGATLQEFRIVWTTWRAWRDEHPDTRVLTEDTGYVRSYGDDPYGSYNPRRRYYNNDVTFFDPLTEDDRLDPKVVVLGARLADHAVAFDKQALLEDRVLATEDAETPLVAVADPDLLTGYVYANPDEREVTAEDGGYAVGDETHEPAALPLERVLAFDSMWFAWAGYYPETSYVE
ncbi:hypothetical protein HALDL1_04530 [Halobacterium sp. DL1]|jgi:hypothetical protein|nr:hypothetical protein HALDL1_04530 [Halobacterium sp. DL1]